MPTKKSAAPKARAASPRKKGASVTDTAETDAKRGRPRPQEVIDRDTAVLKAVTKEGSTSEEISAATGLAKNLVYLSVFRLKRDGLLVAAEGEEARVGRNKRWVHA